MAETGCGGGAWPAAFILGVQRAAGAKPACWGARRVEAELFGFGGPGVGTGVVTARSKGRV